MEEYTFLVQYIRHDGARWLAGEKSGKRKKDVLSRWLASGAELHNEISPAATEPLQSEEESFKSAKVDEAGQKILAMVPRGSRNKGVRAALTVLREIYGRS